MSDEELEVLITIDDDRMVRRALRYGLRNGGKEIQNQGRIKLQIIMLDSGTSSTV